MNVQGAAVRLGGNIRGAANPDEGWGVTEGFQEVVMSDLTLDREVKEGMRKVLKAGGGGGGIALRHHGSLRSSPVLRVSGRCGRGGVQEEKGNAGAVKSLTGHRLEGEKWVDESGWRAGDLQSDEYCGMVCLGNGGQRMGRD